MSVRAACLCRAYWRFCARGVQPHDRNVFFWLGRSKPKGRVRWSATSARHGGCTGAAEDSWDAVWLARSGRGCDHRRGGDGGRRPSFCTGSQNKLSRGTRTWLRTTQGQGTRGGPGEVGGSPRRTESPLNGGLAAGCTREMDGWGAHGQQWAHRQYKVHKR